MIDGYPIGNFSIAANVSQQGRIWGGILFNPPQPDTPLEDIGSVQFNFTSAGVSVADNECNKVKVLRSWPFAQATLSDSRLKSLEFVIRTWAPLAKNDELFTSLPFLMADISVYNSGSQEADVEIGIDTQGIKEVEESFSAREFGLRFDGAGQKTERYHSKRIVVAPGVTSHSKVLLMIYDQEGRSAADFKNIDDLASFAFSNWKQLREATELLGNELPQSGEKNLDCYLRWNMIAATILTKIRRDGTTIAMGYTAMNQRDAFWTCVPHVLLWPSLEKRMLEESARAQKRNGKIPTVIFPETDRRDDIDINCYFILRTIRYYQYHSDLDFIKIMWPSLVRAINFLPLIDNDRVGVPQQHSYWGDWKDVRGVENRKYSPHASLLYMASLKGMIVMAKELGDKKNQVEFEVRFEKANNFVNKSTADGGLWQGDYYVEIMKDGSANDRLLQDQVVGVFFGVVSKKQSESMLRALQQNLTQWGIAETMPYYPEDFGYVPGRYHNGGMWPWLSYAHAWTLIREGQVEAGKELLRISAWADLEFEGDFQPNEYVDTVSGKNRGPNIQGWNACYFGAMLELVTILKGGKSISPSF